MLELSVAPTTRQWCELVKPVVQSMAQEAEQHEEPELCQRLLALGRALERAGKSTRSIIEGTERDSLLAEYKLLVQALPAAFEIEKERQRREPVLVRQLLLQLPGFSDAIIEQLSQGEGMSLRQLCCFNVDALVAKELDRDAASAIVDCFRSYWSDRTAQPLVAGQPGALEKLQALAEQLNCAHQEFQRAEAAEDREKKRNARNVRRLRALQLNVLLAQFGEVDLVAELERAPTEQKVERVRSHIENMKQMSREVIS